jgi:hypothetical protein
MRRRPTRGGVRGRDSFPDGRRVVLLPPQIESLFTRYPALCGFCVRSPAEDELFISDIGVSGEMSAEQYGEIFEQIVVALAEMLCEEPEAGDSLHGRTFARVLH